MQESSAVGRFIFTVAVGIWAGTLISFSYVFLPAIHAALKEDARPLLQRLFPRYHATEIVCGLIALAAVAVAPERSLPIGERLGLGVPIALALLCALIGRQVLLPRLAALDSKAEPGVYERLHRAAAMLNTTILAMLVLVLAAVTAR